MFKLILRSFFYIFEFFILISCCFFDLEGFSLKINTSESNQILLEEKTLWIDFSKEVFQREAEQNISLKFEGDTIPLSYYWEKQRVYLKPKRTLIKGGLYFLKVEGDFLTKSNQHYSYNTIASFYWQTRESYNILCSIFPQRGAIIGTRTPLLFHFKSKVFLTDFKDAFSLSPATEFDLNLKDGGIEVYPKESWENLTYYKWKIDSSLVDQKGLTLSDSVEGFFNVQKDIVPPSLVSYFPVEPYKGGNSFIQSAPSFLDLKGSDSLYFKWSEPINYNSLVTSFSISPPIEGTLYQFSPREFIYVLQEYPLQFWDFLEEYTLSFTTELEDYSKNTLKEPINIRFKSESINPISIESIEITDSFETTVINDFSLKRIISLKPQGPLRRYLTFSLLFSHGYKSVEERKKIEDSILVSEIFPKIESPYKTYFQWVSGRQILIIYEGFATGTTYPLYHEIRIIGGKQTFNFYTGSYIKEDIYVPFNTQ